MLNNVLNLGESKDGNRIKQGDQSVMRYTLSDTNEDNLELDGKQAIVYLYTDKGVAYKQVTTVSNNVVDIVIDEIIPTGHYTLEILVDNKYIFPSDNKTKIEVTSSVLGKGTTEIAEQNLYGDLLDYGISNNKFNGFKGEPGLDGKPFTYEDLTEEQKQDLASYVPVKDIPDSHIIKVIEQDYVNTVGQLDVIFINWKNQNKFYPVVFRKNDYVENDIQDYETWKQEIARFISDFIIKTDVQNEKELFQKAMEYDENSFLGLSLPVFPIYTTTKLPDYSVDDTKYLSNNYLSQAGLIELGDRGTFTAKIAYNGRAIEENKVEINFG